MDSDQSLEDEILLNNGLIPMLAVKFFPGAPRAQRRKVVEVDRPPPSVPEASFKPRPNSALPPYRQRPTAPESPIGVGFGLLLELLDERPNCFAIEQFSLHLLMLHSLQ